jgi:hypothetical protein
MQGEGCVMNKPGFNEYNALPVGERKYHERVGRAFGLSGYDHFQWLGENGVDNMTAFNRFDRAARKAIGRELYNDCAASPALPSSSIASHMGASRNARTSTN